MIEKMENKSSFEYSKKGMVNTQTIVHDSCIEKNKTTTSGHSNERVIVPLYKGIQNGRASVFVGNFISRRGDKGKGMLIFWAVVFAILAVWSILKIES